MPIILGRGGQGFIEALPSVYRWSKHNLKLSFETQFFKRKNEKLIKTFLAAWKNFIFFFFFFFLPLGVIVVKFRTKRKIAIQRTKRVCAGDVFYCHISLNKITASIFQKIHIRKKTLIFAPTEVFERWHKVQTRLQGRFTF